MNLPVRDAEVEKSTKDDLGRSGSRLPHPLPSPPLPCSLISTLTTTAPPPAAPSTSASVAAAFSTASAPEVATRIRSLLTAMKIFRELISSQLLSKSLLSGRPFSFSDEQLPDGELTGRGEISTPIVSGTAHPNTAHSSDAQVNATPSDQLVVSEITRPGQYDGNSRNADPLTKVEALQIKLLRLVYRIGIPPENLVVAQVLYRLHLASLIRDGESDVKRPSLKIDRARAIAAQQEAASQTDLDFAFKILVLGKTGVGKSTTINSLFGQLKTDTHAFHPSTDRIHEVVGTIRGMKVTVIDTPGLSSSSGDQGRNRKILLAVKKFIRKSRPDVILYFERLDFVNKGYSDCSLLKLITNVFGSSIWYNTIVVITHSSSPPLEGPDGYPISFEASVGYCKSILQHYIHQAVSTTQIENHILLVENHPTCRTNSKGEKILPNGQVWMSQFLLLCIATKVLGDANSLLKFQDTIQLTQTSNRLPSLPHLLSSYLSPRSLEDGAGPDLLVDELSDNDEDDYDQLPPIRVLTKAQYKKLSKTQRDAYLDEMDYRETLYLKKQLKEELRRRRESIRQSNDTPESNDYESNDSIDAQVLDFPLPLSFDSDSYPYRYRCLVGVGSDAWVVGPVLDSQGWDHDIGFDGVSLKTSKEVKRNLHASVTGQLSKDKEDLRIQSECAVKYMDPNGHSALAGMDIQTSGKDLICTVHGDTKFKNFNCNSTGGGVSLTSFDNMYFLGAKLEDSVSVGKRFKLSLNTGRMGGCGQVAYGGGLEATIRGKDYPVRDDSVTFAATALSFDKETVLGGSLQSDFRVGHSTKMSVSANINSRRIGQITVRTSTSEHVEIALIAAFSLIKALHRKKPSDVD